MEQLRQLPADDLVGRFGKSGEHLWQLAHGIDDRSVVPDREAKSISHETTFAADISDAEVLRAWLLELTEQVARRLRRHQLRGRTVQLKLRFADFSTITRAQTLPEATHVTQEIWQAAVELLDNALSQGQRSVRLVGVGVSGLGERLDSQGQLFDAQQHERQRALDEVSDRIKDRFGSHSVRRAAGLRPPVENNRPALNPDRPG